jgi:hypothetical protein
MILARALLTHHARDPRTSQRVPDGEENFFGFGMPEPVPYCLECTPYTSTLVFDDVLRPGYFLEWNDFPYPPSLKRDGKYYGEVWMTVTERYAKLGRAHITKTGTTAKVIWNMMNKQKQEQEEGEKANIA